VRLAPAVIQPDTVASAQAFRLANLSAIGCCDEQSAQDDCGEKARTGKELHSRPPSAIIKCVDRDEFARKFMASESCGHLAHNASHSLYLQQIHHPQEAEKNADNREDLQSH
jgi:hypothetical protein